MFKAGKCWTLCMFSEIFFPVHSYIFWDYSCVGHFVSISAVNQTQYPMNLKSYAQITIPHSLKKKKMVFHEKITPKYIFMILQLFKTSKSIWASGYRYYHKNDLVWHSLLSSQSLMHACSDLAFLFQVCFKSQGKKAMPHKLQKSHENLQVVFPHVCKDIS